MSERATPFHCPYCAEEDLFPHEVTDPATGEVSSPAGAWECRACLRAFTVRLLGHLTRPVRGAGTEVGTGGGTEVHTNGAQR